MLRKGGKTSHFQCSKMTYENNKIYLKLNIGHLCVHNMNF